MPAWSIGTAGAGSVAALRRLSPWLIVSAALVGEAAAAGTAALGHAPTALAVHALTACLCTAAGLADRSARPAHAAAMRLLATSLAVMGPLAVVATLALLVLPDRRPETSDDIEAWHSHLFPALEGDPLAQRMQDIRRVVDAADPAPIVAFGNVLRFGTLQQQEHVIALMSRAPRPEFTAMFQAALASNQVGVRAQAAAGLSLLETRAAASIARHRDRLLYLPDGEEHDRTLRNLAVELDLIADGGLMDALRTLASHREAAEIYRDLLQRHDDADLRARLGHALMQLNEFEAAAVELRLALAAGHPDEATFGNLCDCLLQMRRLQDLKHLVSLRTQDLRGGDAPGRDVPRADGSVRERRRARGQGGAAVAADTYRDLEPALQFWDETSP